MRQLVFAGAVGSPPDLWLVDIRFLVAPARGFGSLTALYGFKDFTSLFRAWVTESLMDFFSVSSFGFMLLWRHRFELLLLMLLLHRPHPRPRLLANPPTVMEIGTRDEILQKD